MYPAKPFPKHAAAGGRGARRSRLAHAWSGATWAIQHEDGGGGGGGDQLHRVEAAGQAGVVLIQQGAAAPGRW